MLVAVHERGHIRVDRFGDRVVVPQAVGEPRAVEIRQVVGPPWHEVPLLVEHAPVQRHGVAHEREPAVPMRLMNPER